MNAPRELDRVGKAAFKQAAAILAELGEPIDLSAPALLAYARAESVAAAVRAEWWADPRAVVPGGRGAKVTNPVLRELERCEKLAAELREQLALTPLARRRAGRSVRGGRPMGAASAADRAQPPRRRRGNVIAMPQAVREALGDA